MRLTSSFCLTSFLAGALVACGGPVGNTLPPETDAGTDVAMGQDTPMGQDAPVGTDRPQGTDTPMGTDRPATTDTPTAMDRPMTQDTPGTTDTPATDRTVITDRPAPDVPPATNTCSMSAIVNLNTAGMLTLQTLRYTGNTSMSPERGTLTPPCGTGDRFQLALRYTPRASTRVRVSTNYMGTAADFDTVVWIQSMCAPMAMGDRGLGCNDDGGQAPRTLASVIAASERLTAGTPVFIFVGGFGTGMGNRGAFEITVTELTEVATGMACNPMVNVCAMGASCVGADGMQRCVADGTAGGRCRTAMGTTPCDMALSCSVGLCQASIAIGMPCGGMITAPCAMGSSCQGATGAQRCVADGTAGGRCRTLMGMTPCDMGLMCSGMTVGTCGGPIATGMPCGMPGNTGVCAMGTACRGVTGSQTCVSDGFSGGRCRTAMGATPCETGLTCASGTCITTVAAGMPCDVSNPGQRCATGTTCAPMGTGTTTTCQRDGTAAGTPCNDAAPLCAMGLTCDGEDSQGNCRRPGTLGMACDLRFNSVACPAGSACLGTSATAATCTMTRAETEPNNTVMMPQAAITAGTAFSGSVGAMTDPLDCYGVTVPANGTVVVETGSPGDPGCGTNDTVATLYNPMGAQVANNDDGPGRNFCSYFSARALAAGAYVVCVRSLSGPIMAYTVSIGVFGP